MFDALGEKFERLFKRLRGEARITERNIEEALREVRLALLEADVNLQVVNRFVEALKAEALGQEVLASLTPEQHFIKIVHRELVRLLGGEPVSLDLSGAAPLVLMLVGLNGSGKTTTAAKLARWLKTERGRHPYLVPADLRRPAAVEQLRVLGEKIGCPVHPSAAGADPLAVCRQARTLARAQGYDTLVIDTAGRLHVNEELMAELASLAAAVEPRHVLLVADAMTGQDAVNVAAGFAARLRLSGVILTKTEGDARGGAALSLREVTGQPIVFVGTGEQVECLEPFFPERAASRILGMGDILSLIERAEKAYDQRQAKVLERKLRRNEFDLEDFRDQLRAIRRMGPITELLGMVPGMKGLVRALDPAQADGQLRKVEAIINSMTIEERRNVGLLNGSRRRRIAAGSGTSVADVNRLVKQFTQAKKLFRKLGSRGMPPLPR